MVQSKAGSVDDYLSEVSSSREPDLRRIRETARRTLRSCDERMVWGRPTYLRRGRAVFGFAEQKQYVSLYFDDPEMLTRHAGFLGGATRGKGCLRFRGSTPLDWTLLEHLLSEAERRALA